MVAKETKAVTTEVLSLSMIPSHMRKRINWKVHMLRELSTDYRSHPKFSLWNRAVPIKFPKWKAHQAVFQ